MVLFMRSGVLGRAGMASQRLMEEALPIVYRGTKYEDCLPIGKMEIVDNFPYKALRDYTTSGIAQTCKQSSLWVILM